MLFFESRNFIATLNLCYKKNESCKIFSSIPKSQFSHHAVFICHHRMINGLNPLQLGRIKPKTLTYPRLTSNSFVNGCIRRLTDNGVMYDFANPVEKHSDVVFGCPHAGCKPACVNGHCDETRWPFKCVCLPGYIGDTCKERKYMEQSNSWSMGRNFDKDSSTSLSSSCCY